VYAGPKTLSRGMAAHEIEKEREYNPTSNTKGVTNNSLTSRSSHTNPIIDCITKTPSLSNGRFPQSIMMALLIPIEYVVMYTNQTSLYSTLNDVLCKACSSTLQGPTLDWFTNLALFSISFFDTLTLSFTTHSRKVVGMMLPPSLMAYPRATTKHTQEELESSMKGKPKLLSLWAISEFLKD